MLWVPIEGESDAFPRVLQTVQVCLQPSVTAELILTSSSQTVGSAVSIETVLLVLLQPHILIPNTSPNPTVLQV